LDPIENKSVELLASCDMRKCADRSHKLTKKPFRIGDDPEGRSLRGLLPRRL
jgi:hypothetical protein